MSWAAIGLFLRLNRGRGSCPYSHASFSAFCCREFSAAWNPASQQNPPNPAVPSFKFGKGSFFPSSFPWEGRLRLQAEGPT